MIELDSIATVLRRTSHFYWLFAIVAIVLAVWFGKTWRAKTAWALVAIALFGFIPAREAIEQSRRDVYAREAWAYFKKLCAEKSGEKIYKTYTGVKSVLVIKALPPATEKDLQDQFWYGDPYSDATPWDKRAELAASRLAWSDGPVSPTERGKGFDFVEALLTTQDGGVRALMYSYPKGARDHVSTLVDKPVSRFGILWEDISTPEDRKYWVAASRLRAIDLTDDSIVAERTGFLIESGFGSTAGGRRPWLAAKGLGQNGRLCPDAHDYSDRWFLLRVFKPTDGVGNGK